MFPIEVEAVEVVGGAEYQCDISGAIADLGTVLAGIYGDELSCGHELSPCKMLPSSLPAQVF